MSSRTTKAQRRAAKLNRRSKDYRRQIAAQARKEEQAKKPAKKQTTTKAKNPSPKKVYEPSTSCPSLISETVYYDNLPMYRKGVHVPILVFVRMPDRTTRVIVGAFDWDYAKKELPDLNMAEVTLTIAEDYAPTFKAAFGVVFPKGTDMNDLREFVLEDGTIDYFEGLLDAMERKNKIAASGDFVKVVKSMRQWSRNAA